MKPDKQVVSDLLKALRTILDLVEAEGEYGDDEQDAIRDKVMQSAQAAIDNATQ